ncbi:UDP-glucose/GDP-mannose dehydrogenase family protein [archaeon]|nr:MAG: UDP-glucose/GDP-mannose dehydrogenase family protein [archaeon]
MKKISIIVSGNVGRRIGKEFLRHENEVVFYDISYDVVEELKKNRYDASLDVRYAINKTDISFVAVPTPLGEDDTYDISFLKDAAAICGASLKKKDDYHIFVLKSTVTPGTTEKDFIPALEKYSGKQEGDGFGVVYNPEFLTVIQNTWTDKKDFCISPGNEGRIVLGEGKNKKAGNIIEKLFKEENSETPILRTDYNTAELTKLVANNRLPLVISFSNEIYEVAEELKKNNVEVDADFIMNAVAMDSRIGPYGSVFGKAWGGPCFTKDTKALKKWIEKETGQTPKIISSSIEVNNMMKKKYGVRE